MMPVRSVLIHMTDPPESDLCRICGSARETIQHLFWDCHVFQDRMLPIINSPTIDGSLIIAVASIMDLLNLIAETSPFRRDSKFVAVSTYWAFVYKAQTIPESSWDQLFYQDFINHFLKMASVYKIPAGRFSFM